MKKKVSFWKSGILIACVIFIIVVATFSWFVTGPSATLGEMDINVGVATYVQVFDKDANEWVDDLDVPAGLFDSFKEISGNGKTFWAPIYVDDFVHGDYVRYISAFENVSNNSQKYYYEEELSFRSDTIQDVFLDPASYVNAIGNGKISGAVRVAFFEVNGDKETLSFIWAPNSTIDINSEEAVGSVEPYYFYQKTKNFVDPASLEEMATTNDIAIIATGEQPCGYDAMHSFLWTNRLWDEESETWGDLQVFPENPPAVLKFKEADLTTSVDGKTCYEKKLKVRIWIEGHDRECISLISGQRFEIKLKFSVEEENNHE